MNNPQPLDDPVSPTTTKSPTQPQRGARRRHVMEVTWSLVAGGSEVYAFTVASHLDPKLYRATLCAIDEGGALESEVKQSPIPYCIMWRRPGLDFRLMWRLFRLFRRLRVDVLHTHHFNQLFYSVLGAKLLGIRIIHTEHDTEIQKRPRLRLALGLLSRFCYRMIAIGSDIATMFETQIGIPAHKIEIVRAGVNLSTYNQNRSAARQSLGLREQDRVVVIVARLYPEKNHLLLLRAFAEVTREVENARLLIVGEGTERAAIRATIDELGLTHEVQLLGVRRDVALILAASDVFALSSNREGLPIAILEAMAAGCPVVATRVGDVPEVVRDGFNGYLVPPQDQMALAQALVTTLNDPQQAATLGANARATAQGYSVRAMLDKYEALFAN